MRIDSRSPLCGHYLPTVHYILLACPIALQQDRYTWKYDSTLNVLANCIKSALTEVCVLANLPGLSTEENYPSTIPSEKLVTTAQSDIAVINNREVPFIKLPIFLSTLNPECLANTKQCKETYRNPTYH